MLPVATYLANRLEANGRAVPYSAIAALDPAAAAPFGGFVLRDGGGPVPALAEGEILVDDWVADDLGIDAGDDVVMTYFEVGPKEELLERRETFRCRGVVKLSNLAADPGLTPDFPGISGAADMREWDPPFPVDLDAIRPRDEAFWDQYRATPKAFFAPATAKLWSTRFGATTSMRVAVPPAQDGKDVDVDGGGAGVRTAGGGGERDLTGILRARVDAELPRAADPAALGFRFDPVRERGLQASAGATDFRWLFLGFSSFLIASAAILVALFFTLGIERRASEIGLLLAAGYPLRTVRRRFLVEGLVLGAIGIVVGAAGAALYAGLMIAALRTWWRAAVGTPFLYLHVEPLTLAAGVARRVPGGGALDRAVGAATGAAVGGRAAARRHHRAATTRGHADRPPRSRWIWRAAAVLGVVLLGAGAVAGLESSPAIFFAAGASLLVAGLAFFALRLRRPRRPAAAPARATCRWRRATRRSTPAAASCRRRWWRRRRSSSSRSPPTGSATARKSTRSTRRRAATPWSPSRRCRCTSISRPRRRRSSSACNPPPASCSPRAPSPRSASCPATT